MEFCYTLPLQRRLNMKPLTSQTAAAPFFCWDVHLLTVQGRKAVLAMNRASRYSLLFYGMNRADWTHLPELVRDEIRAVILREGLSEFEAARYFALGGPLNISTAHGSTLARILATLFFWALCYKLVSLKLMGSLTLPDVVDAVKHLLLFHHEEHFYYLHILGNRLCVLCRGPAERTLFRGNGLGHVPGRFRGMGPLSNSLFFTNRSKAGRFYLQSLLLRLSHTHFLPPSLCAMGSPGRRRAGAADGAADFGADYLLLLCRLCSPVPDSGCPALADIAV